MSKIELKSHLKNHFQVHTTFEFVFSIVKHYYLHTIGVGCFNSKVNVAYNAIHCSCIQLAYPTPFLLFDLTSWKNLACSWRAISNI